jgi:hypothetical protein
MKIAIAKRHIVNSAIAYAQRVTTDVTRYAEYADKYVRSVQHNAHVDRIHVIEEAARHIMLSRSAGTSYKQLRKLYPPMPGANHEKSAIIQRSAPQAPPPSNTGETFPGYERPGGGLGTVLVDGKPVEVFDVLGDYV